MNHLHHQSCAWSRRQFLRTSAAGVAAAGLHPMAFGESGLGSFKLPRRRYGRTDLEISSIIGASNMTAELIPMEVQSGVNYWHKADKWTIDTLPPAIRSQPRESYYLEIIVPRINGNHRTGIIEEEAHYQYVKDSLKKSGFGYYDVFKHYFGYHSINEAKTNPGMI